MTVNPFNSINEVKKLAENRVYHNNNKCSSGVLLSELFGVVFQSYLA